MVTMGILLFPEVEELDFAGPFEVLSYVNKLIPASVEVKIIAETLEPVKCYNGLRVLPDMTIEECPQLDILVIPGGQGRKTATKNIPLLDFIKRQHEGTIYTCSVCTGAFLLAEAGLLFGKKATTYHTAFGELDAFPNVTVSNAKVVQDGKVITGGGVSSGLELGFHVVQLLFGRLIAQEVARRIEYNWVPANGQL